MYILKSVFYFAWENKDNHDNKHTKHSCHENEAVITYQSGILNDDVVLILC